MSSASSTHEESVQNTEDVRVFESNSHPLFLHDNDHPGMILTSKKLTGAENFAAWKRSIKIALSAKNKMAITDGTYPIPAENSSLCNQWMRVNDMIISWIMNTVSDEISDSMKFVETTAFSVWTELTERFSSVDGRRIYELHKDISILGQENLSVDMYYHKLKALWDEHAALEVVPKCTCGASKAQDEQEQRRKLMQFLMGLHDSFASARDQILMMSPLPTVTHAYSLIKQDEKQRQGYQNGNVNPNFMAFTSSSGFQNRKKFTNAQYNSQFRPHVPKEGMECSYCHGKNHIKETCFKLNGYPKGHPLHNKPKIPLTGTGNIRGITKKDNLSQGNSAYTSNLPQWNSTYTGSKPMQVHSEEASFEDHGRFEQLEAKIDHLLSIIDKGKNKDFSSPDEHLAGDLKRIIAEEIGLDPKAQRLFFRGIEKEDQVSLHMAGVKNNSTLLFMENSDGKEMLEEVKVPEISRGSEAVAEVRAEVDNLAEHVDALKTVIYVGTKVAERDINFLLEMLERQLLKLDNIKAEGEGRVQRKMEVCRVQSLLDTADNLKKRNSCPNSNGS